MAVRKQKILAVEDDANLARLLEVALPRHGFTVRVVNDGKSAVDIAAQWCPDIVLLDLDLPILNGLEVLSQFRERNLETRVVVMSGSWKDVDTVIRCIKGGACDFLTKPVEISEVAKCLFRHLVIDSKYRFAGSAELAAKNRDLQTALEDTVRRTRRLKRRNLQVEIATKFLYLCMASAATLVAVKFCGVPPGYSAGVLLLGILLLLVVPQERLRLLTARWGSGEATLQMEPAEHAEPVADISEPEEFPPAKLVAAGD